VTADQSVVDGGGSDDVAASGASAGGRGALVESRSRRRRHDRAGFARLGAFVVRRPVVIIGCWIVAAALMLMLPSLTEMVGQNPPTLLPSDAPSAASARAMAEVFDQSGSRNVVLVVLTNEGGLNSADEEIYTGLVRRLHADTANVATVQDITASPDLRALLTGADNKAWVVPVTITGELGTPRADGAYRQVVRMVNAAVAHTSLTASFAGPAATIDDMTTLGERDVRMVEIATAALVLMILLIVYRNPVTMLVPLATIGVSTVVAHGMVAGVGQLGLALSSQTIMLMSGVMVGAGTDYAVFLINRYHEFVRAGSSSDQAVCQAVATMGAVLAASAATVAVTFLGMTFAQLGVVSMIGPALAITVVVGFAAAVTLLPAILALVGRRGWVAPGREVTTRWWRRAGVNIVRRPVVHLVISLTILAALACCTSVIGFDYDDRDMLPASAESNRGYTTLGRHFATNSTLPQYLLVQSPRDLRTPQAFADLEVMAQRVSQVRDVAAVRGPTRPSGAPLEQAKVSNQAGQLGNQLSGAATSIADSDGRLNALSRGSRLLADTIANIGAQVGQTLGVVDVLVDAAVELVEQPAAEKTLDQVENAASIAQSLRVIGDIMGGDLHNQQSLFDTVAAVVDGLNASPVCDINESCATTRGQLQRLVVARNSGAFDALNELSRTLQAFHGEANTGVDVHNLRKALEVAISTARSLGVQGRSVLRQKFDTLGVGVNGLAQGSRQLADGVQALVDKTRQLGAGLNQAGTMLSLIMNNASQPSMAGFFIPQQVLDSPEFKKIAAMTVSADGHAVRYLVQSRLNPFSAAAMNQVGEIQNAARTAQPNTSLADASISLVGIPVASRDINAYYDDDAVYIGVLTIVVVLAILMLLLRAVVAPLYLVASVIVSYLSALGIGVIAFQVLLHQRLSWTVPCTAFTLLVAVGADYNMVLISRIREESSSGMRLGVIRTVASTGSAITSAGIIFAASMFGLLLSGIAAVVQIGFVVGVGLLLDTFLVRTITVPAIAAVAGSASWWPSGVLTAMRRGRARRQAVGAAMRRGDLVRPSPIWPIYSRRSWSKDC
jgi:putative drug exporter of the RND superfamily